MAKQEVGGNDLLEVIRSVQNPLFDLNPDLFPHILIGGSIARLSATNKDVDVIIIPNPPEHPKINYSTYEEYFDNVYGVCRKSQYSDLLEIRNGLFEGEQFISLDELISFLTQPQYTPQRFIVTLNGFQRIEQKS